MACIKCGTLLPTQRFDLQLRRTLPWTNASLHQPPLYARRKLPARSAVVPLEEARSSSLVWEARAKAQRIVTSSSSVRVGAAVPPKSGCLRYWKACGRVSQLRCIAVWRCNPAWAFLTARRAKVRSIGYGIRSDFELNCGRYLPALGRADDDETNTQPD